MDLLNWLFKFGICSWIVNCVDNSGHVMVSISGLPPPVVVVGKTAYFWQFFSKEHIFKSWNIRSCFKEYVHKFEGMAQTFKRGGTIASSSSFSDSYFTKLSLSFLLISFSAKEFLRDKQAILSHSFSPIFSYAGHTNFENDQKVWWRFWIMTCNN